MSSLSAVYQQFLAAPSQDALANDAALNYVTTLTSFSDSAKVINHLGAQQRVLRKKSEKILSAIGSQNAVFLEVETIIEFISGGSAYLPGLDDNFLADREVVLPIVSPLSHCCITLSDLSQLHVVHFGPQGKIQNIRLYWDQGSLLKTVEVIGSRGNNWPIVDGKDQVQLIKTSEHSAASNGASESSRKQSSTGSRAAKDPRRNIEAFGAYTEDPEKTPTFKSPPIAPRASAKPPPRDFNDLFAGDSDADAGGPPSPTKSDIIAPKIGAGKNYHGNRLFEETPGEGLEKYISPHPTKYNHFEFGDGHDEPAAAPSPPKPKTKHQHTWDFEDFVTPAKVVPRRAHESRNFVFGDETPSNKPASGEQRKTSGNAARRDAETHFELLDDGGRAESPANAKRSAHPRGQGSMNASASLFQNNIISEDGAANAAKTARPLSQAVSQKDRNKDFGAHWQMTDDPKGVNHGVGLGKPAGAVTSQKDRDRDFGAQWEMRDDPRSGGLGEKSASETNRPTVSANKTRVQKMMERGEDSPDSTGEKENQTGRGINIGGDGMGGRKGTNPLAGGKENSGSSGGIRTGGDGMGGRKGAGRQWGIGEEDQPPLGSGGGGMKENQRPARKMNTSNLPTAGFWGVEEWGMIDDKLD